MTKDGWVQGLIDDYAMDILNYIRDLPLSHYEKTMLEIKSKELLMNIASRVMHETKDECMDVFAGSVGVKKID